MGQGVTIQQLLPSALALLIWSTGLGVAAAQETPADEKAVSAKVSRVGYLVRIPLPITGDVRDRVKLTIDRLLARPQPADQRPLFIFELWPNDKESRGAGSSYTDALDIANKITGPEFAKVETVAFIPRSIRGHAVLVALACERIVMAGDAELGEAGYEESRDPTVNSTYEGVAGRRNTIPKAVALGMLDPQVKVYWVKAPQVRFVLEKELDDLRTKGLASEVDTIKQEGELGKYTGQVLRDNFRFVSHLARDRRELEQQLKLPAGSIEVDPTLGEEVRAIRVKISGPTGAASWAQKAIDDAIRNDKANLIILELDSNGGSLLVSLQLASFLSDLDDTRVRTIAYIPSMARSDAALIAWACDHVVLHRGAELGGVGSSSMEDGDREQVIGVLKKIAEKNSRPWSLTAAMLDPMLKVRAYRHADTGAIEYFCEAEFKDQPDPKLWTAGDEVTNGQPFLAADDEAVRKGLARQVVESYDQLKKEYQIAKEPLDISPNWAHRLIVMLADPYLAGFLVFVGFFALMVEAKSPGIGAGAFIACICFLLFFWGQILEGNAGYLEVLMFITGVICVALEIFILPGFGIFGIGGGLLIIFSLILASQTFVIPRNLYELQQLPTSIFTVIAAMMGVLAAIYIVGRYLPHTPYLSNMMLKPPAGEAAETIARREQLADFAHLVGKGGSTTTPLVPAGKARIGDDVIDVLSEGDLIPRGVKIVVVEALGNRVVVRQAKED